MIFPKDHNKVTEQEGRLIYFKAAEESENKDRIAQGALALLDGMQTSVSDLDKRIAGEADEIKKAEMMRQKHALESTLNLRKAPIESRKSFDEAMDLIQHDQFLLKRLDKEAFDQLDLKFLMESDLMPFFDGSSQGQLSKAFEQMNTSDFVQNTLRPGDVHLETPLHGKRYFTGFPDVMKAVDPAIIRKIKLTLEEAQYIRLEKSLEYLEERFAALSESVSKSADKKIFDEKSLEALKEELKEGKRLLFDRKGQDPAFLRTLADNIEAATETFGISEAEMQQVKDNREQIESELQTDYEKMYSVITSLNPGQIEELIKKYRKRQAEKGEPEDSAIVRKATVAWNELKDPASELNRRIASFDKRMEDMSKISGEELIAVRADLKRLSDKLDFIDDLEESVAENSDAQKAHATIADLEGAKSPEEVKTILETNLGKEHLEFVPHGEFEEKYRQYTEKGHMVFYERGDEWKIILDESALSGAETVDVLKKQLTHELLHLEFEKSKDVKDQIRRQLVEGNPKQWQKIRAAFIEMAESTNKMPPSGEEWEDDDILSELYAMQNEMGQFWSKGDTPTDKLNNLLVGAGISSAFGGDMAEKTRGYEEGAKIRGYEDGVEAGEEGLSPGEPATIVETQTKSEAVYQKNQETIDHIKERIKELQKSEYIDLIPGAPGLLSAMSDFTDQTEDLNSDVRHNPDSEIISMAITERNKQVSGDLNDLEDKVGKAARTAPNNEIGFFRKIWLNTTFLSIEDFIQVGIDVYEFYQRRHKRKAADHAAQLGMALFANTDLGREARARQQKAEAEEVNEWKSRYENLDAWQLEDEIAGIAQSTLPNADQLKAILRILAEKGRINWRNENLWIILNKLQAAVVLKPGDPILLHNPILLRQRLHRALGEIYDYDEFTSLERSNESSYEGEKGKYDTVHDRTQDKLTDRLDQLLSQYRDNEQVDPILYESILEYCIKNGKSYAENVMFHLIAGMAEGILAPDRGLALGKHLNTWPPIDWFPSRKPPYSQADWKWLCETNFKESFELGSITSAGGADFKNWYWTEVQNNQAVIERVQKSVGERGWDHDWGRSIACLGDADTAKRFLAGRSGQQETKATAVGNAYVGAVQWLEENAKNPQFANKDSFARMAGWIAMSEGILYGTAYNRKESDISTRQNESMNASMPRERGIGNHKDFTTKQFREITESFLFMIDFDFFSLLSGKECREDAQKKELGQQAAKYLAERYPTLAAEMANVETIDQVYDRLDLIIKTMFDQMDEPTFQMILANLAANAG